MPPQPFEFRLDNLERHVTQLEQLPARIEDLTLQVSHLRTEMRGEFSAVRTELAEQGATIIATLRGEMAEQGRTIIATLRGEMAEQGRTIVGTLRGEMAEQSATLRTEIRDLATRMLVLHEEVISRIAVLQEGRSRPATPRPRKK